MRFPILSDHEGRFPPQHGPSLTLLLGLSSLDDAWKIGNLTVPPEFRSLLAGVAP